MGTGRQRGGNSLSVKVSVEGSKRQRGNPDLPYPPTFSASASQPGFLLMTLSMGEALRLCGPPG